MKGRRKDIVDFPVENKTHFLIERSFQFLKNQRTAFKIKVNLPQKLTQRNNFSLFQNHLRFRHGDFVFKAQIFETSFKTRDNRHASAFNPAAPQKRNILETQVTRVNLKVDLRMGGKLP